MDAVGVKRSSPCSAQRIRVKQRPFSPGADLNARTRKTHGERGSNAKRDAARGGCFKAGTWRGRGQKEASRGSGTHARPWKRHWIQVAGRGKIGHARKKINTNKDRDSGVRRMYSRSKNEISLSRRKGMCWRLREQRRFGRAGPGGTRL